MHFRKLSHISTIFFLLGIIVSSFSKQTAIESSSFKPLKIKKLEIYGNKKTKRDAIKALFGLDTGAQYDSQMVADGERRLERTDLFSKVDVLTLKKADGVDLYIIIEEKFYLLPYDFGGEYFLQKYGQNEFWWRLRLGMEFNNFRGRMETLRASFSFWDWRSLAFSWQKPLLSTPYYFIVGAGVDYYPDEIEWSDNTTLVGRFIAGKKVASRSRIALGLVPIYRNELHSSTFLQPDSTRIIIRDTLNNYELFSIFGWSSDFRKSPFDPSGGWYLYTDLKTNVLYAGKYNPYFQFSSDLRLYHHGIFKDNKVACRIATVFRNTDGGPLNNLQYGGEGTVRGYLHRQFGSRFEVNNSFMLSMEYRFPIYDFPPLEFPFLASYNKALASLQYRVDGALIFDYGRFSKDFKDLFALDAKKMESGIGLGIGLRVMLPLFEKSVCADLVWGENPYTETLDFYRIPIFHAYLDMFY